MATPTEVLEELRRIAREELDLQRELKGSDELLADLELDSVSLTVVAVGLEDRFRVKIPDEQALGVRTVDDLAALVSRLTLEAPRRMEA